MTWARSVRAVQRRASTHSNNSRHSPCKPSTRPFSSRTARSRCSTSSTTSSAIREFLPWCGGSEVIASDGGRQVARIDINYQGVRAHFTTENVNEPPSRSRFPAGRALQGAEGQVAFRALAPDACKVEFDLAYEFETPVLEVVVGPVFNHIANTFIDAFVRRAEAVYANVMKVDTVAYAAPGIEAIVPSTAGGSTVDDAIARERARRRFAIPAAIGYAIHGQRARAKRRLPTGTGSSSCGRSSRTPSGATGARRRPSSPADAQGQGQVPVACPFASAYKLAPYNRADARLPQLSCPAPLCPWLARRSRLASAAGRAHAQSALAVVATAATRRQGRGRGAQDVRIYALGLIGVDYRSAGRRRTAASTAAVSSAMCSRKSPASRCRARRRK